MENRIQPGTPGSAGRGRRRRAVAAAAVCLSLSLTAGACGLTGDSGDGASTVSGTITWWDTSGEAENPHFAELVAAFEAEYPAIEVDHVGVPFDQARQKFLDAVESGRDVPDVLRADVGWTAGFAAEGHLADLTGTSALDGDISEDFLPSTTASVVREDGSVHGVPQVTDTLALLYNRRIFEEAGIARPPATWKELKDVALRIREETGAEGIVLNPDPFFSLPFLYGEESDLVDVDAQSITVANEASVRGVSTAADLVSSGAAPEPPREDAYAAMQNAFKEGEAAMMINGPWATSEIFTSPEFENRDNLGIAAVPAGSTGTAGSPTGGHNLVVAADSDDLEASYLFVRFMTDAEQQEKTALALGLLPTRTAAYTDKVLSDPVRNSFYLALTKAVARPSIPESGRLFTLLQPHYTAILRGEETPEEGLARTAEEWNEQLLPGYRVER
ncbi:extracellular solute-binding protein [Streptomyces sp. TRM43335]|uniref:Extracellular solute-binding protein n=1 Tax=Streptomyces taklimakanensis TaxID=2569853 RepID=A0A6G2B9G2_9ACTN|nr:extracellular solute-binding protein [Streptomyces taklimakanensis]MTE18766.1 extracellular solute-binding protein [Streptomyces taklimakanensis]